MTIEQTSCEFVVEDSDTWANHDRAYQSEIGEIKGAKLAALQGEAPFSGAVLNEKSDGEEEDF